MTTKLMQHEKMCMKTTLNHLKKLKNVIISVNEEPFSRYQMDAGVLLMYFNASAIEVDPPAVLSFLLTSFGDILQDLLDAFGRLEAQLEQVKRNIATQLQKVVDLPKRMEPLMLLWGRMAVHLDHLIGNLSTVFKDNIYTTVAFIQPFLQAAVVGPGTCILAIFIILTVITVIYIVDAWKPELLHQKKQTSETIGMNFSLPIDPN